MLLFVTLINLSNINLHRPFPLLHEDFASIMLGYKNDKVAIISSNWITPKKIRKFNAVCTEAIITSDFISQEIIVEKDEGSKTIQNEKQEPLLLEIKSFLEAIEGKNEPRTRSASKQDQLLGEHLR